MARNERDTAALVLAIALLRIRTRNKRNSTDAPVQRRSFGPVDSTRRYAKSRRAFERARIALEKEKKRKRRGGEGHNRNALKNQGHEALTSRGDESARRREFIDVSSSLSPHARECAIEDPVKPEIPR